MSRGKTKVGLMKSISRLFFCLTGWKVEGRPPEGVKKCIMVAAPHTSNWDFPYSLGAFYIMQIRIKYLMKKEWLKSPVGSIFKASGAIGVERDKTSNMVEQIVEKMNKASELLVLISPEGTRSKTRKWKTGFYHMALQAEVPIVFTYLDYKKKIAKVGPAFHPTGNFKQDMQMAFEFYKNVTPRHPHKYQLEIF